MTAEIGAPGDVTFVFGHTHKPFVDMRTTRAFPSPVSVVNTGGWVVDTPQLNPLKGASLILIDEELNVACVRCYTEGADPSSYRVRIEPSAVGGPQRPGGPARLGSSTPTPSRGPPWPRPLRTTVADRGRQLAERLRADASTLNRLNQDGRAAEGSGA